MTDVSEGAPEQEVDRLRRLVGERPHDVDAIRDLALALLADLDGEADLSAADEPAALLRTALELAGEEPLDRAAICADLADVHAWRSFTAAERGVDTAAADRDAAIGYWMEAEFAADDAGAHAELIATSPPSVLEQIDLLIGRAVEAGDDDLDNAIELAELLIDELPEDDQHRDAARFGHALARALRYDRRPARTADLEAAIDGFRELWHSLSEEHPLHTDTAAWLGLVLAARVRHDEPEVADHVREALAQLAAVSPDAAVYPVVRLHLGAMLAVRYLYLAGGTEVRDAAVAVLRGLLELPELDEFAADVCHVGLALLTLAEAAPGARRWRLAPGERALDRMLRAADEKAQDEARRHLEALTDHARATLLPAVAAPPEDPDEIVDTVTLFGAGHPMRGVLLNVLGTTAQSQEVHAEMLALIERAVRHIPDDSPSREQVLSVLTTSGAQAIVDGDGATVEALRLLLVDVVSRPAADRANEAVNNFLLAIVTTARGLATQDADLLSEAIQRTRDTAKSAPAGHWTAERAEGLLSSLLYFRWVAGTEREYLDASVYYSGSRTAASPEEAAAERVDALTSSLLAQLSSDSSRAIAELSGTIAELDEEGGRLPNEHAKRSTAAIMANLARVHLAGREHGFHSPAAQASAISFGHVAEASVSPNDRDPYAVVALANARMTSAFARRDLDEVDQAIAGIAAASTSLSLEDRERAVILSQLGLAFCMRYELTRQVRDLHLGIDRMEEAARLFRQQPGGIFPPMNAMSLAKAYHTRGDEALGDGKRAAAAGLAALRDRAADVRVQAGTRRAMDAASTVARDAVEVVRWSLAAEQSHLAVTALELGRGMVVHVATSDPSVPAALRARGAHDLAAEWEESTVDSQVPWDLPHTDLLRGVPQDMFAGLTTRPVPNDLRRRALRVIGEDEEPPSIPEIAGTLLDRRTTALVYLLPRDRYGPGVALLVSHDEKLTVLSLSELDTSAHGRIAEMRDVREELARAEAGTPEWARLRERGQQVLGEVCDWAWTAAMANVLDALPAAHPARLVIVPVGDLAVVPWHAARRTVGGGDPRYACQDAIISYAASARQFVDASRRPTRPWQSAPGLVRAADTLYWASREIEGIRDRYYPDATYLGGRGRRSRPGHRPATPDNVRALLPGPDSPGASVIHLGCHAHLADPPIDSYLSLDTGRLQVGDILDQARQRPLDAPGGLVVLAACASDASEFAHDESLSLATAFLATGAAGVVGARWAVDDVPTAAFMIMFHHYLSYGYPEPATALRATQLWMLNPRRRLPAGFDGVLADELTQLDLTEVANWGAFTYQGR